MAQKAAKSTARRNTQVLNRTHLILLGVNAFFLLVRGLLFRASLTRRSLLLYLLLSTPSFVIAFLFERNSRPAYTGNELRRAGEDLDAKGLTEWMWDVLYWTWGCVIAAAVLGDWVWWLYLAVPVYSLWLAYSTFGSVRQALAGGGVLADPMAQNGQAGSTGSSKRQQKMEKRGNKVQYR